MGKKRQIARRRARNSKWQTEVAQEQEEGWLPPIPGLMLAEGETADPSKLMAEWRAQVNTFVAAKSKELTELLQQYEPLSMISAVAASQTLIDTENYSESTDEGMIPAAELIAGICLSLPPQDEYPRQVDYAAVARAVAIARSLFNVEYLFSVIGSWGKSNEPSIQNSVREIAQNTRQVESFVGPLGYLVHQRKILVGLFGPFDKELLDLVGFSIAEVIAVNDAALELLNDRLQECLAGAVKDGKALRSRVRQAKKERYRMGGSSAVGVPPELLATTGKWTKKLVYASTFYQAFALMGERAAFTLSELAEAAGVPLERVQAIVLHFAARRGPEIVSSVSPASEIRTHPFVVDGDRVVYPFTNTLLWAVQENLESQLGSRQVSSKVFDSYSKRRGEYLESEAIALLSRALRADQVFRKLHYRFDDGKGLQEYELDGLLIADQTLILLEAKAGAYTSKARLGRTDRVKSRLEDLLGEAQAQLSRAKRFIGSSEEVEFVTEDGNIVHIKGSDFRRILPVAASLERLDLHQANMTRLVEAGILAPEELPWAVSLPALMVIADHIEFSGQLIHYIERRDRLNDQQKVAALEELDLFGAYLRWGLYFDGEEFSQVDGVALASHTDPFDGYYLHEEGIRKTPAEKLRMPIPPTVHRIISELDEHRSPGYTEVILQILNLKSESHDNLSRAFDLARAMAKESDSIRDVTIITQPTGGRGISVFAAPAHLHLKAMQQLMAYCQTKKYKLRAAAWTGLLAIVDSPELVAGMVTSGELPWQYDEEWEDATRDLPEAPIQSASDLWRKS